mmetsp:Transcript_21545/g.52446  ORF Transcript_21545/g.52446 Transcript_21545/m.52446 type:complete len:451 (-) Transcript_21545:1823-3175(-)
MLGLSPLREPRAGLEILGSLHGVRILVHSVPGPLRLHRTTTALAGARRQHSCVPVLRGHFAPLRCHCDGRNLGSLGNEQESQLWCPLGNDVRGHGECLHVTVQVHLGEQDLGAGVVGNDLRRNLLCFALRGLRRILARLHELPLQFIDVLQQLPFPDQRHLAICVHGVIQIRNLLHESLTLQGSRGGDSLQVLLRPHGRLNGSGRASDSSQPTDALGHSLLGQDHKSLNFGRIRHMRPAAKLHGNFITVGGGQVFQQHFDILADGNDPDDIRVLLAEHASQAVDLEGLLLGCLLAEHLHSLGDLQIDDLFHLLHFLQLHGLVVVEIEREPVLQHARPLLVHLLPQHPTQPVVHQVSRRVILGDQSATLEIDGDRDFFPDLQAPGGHFANVQDVPCEDLRVAHLHLGAAGRDRPDIEALASLLGVERSLVKYDADGLELGIDGFVEMLSVK